MDSSSDSRVYEVRWHGRGGQGAITAAQILATAIYIQGYRGVTATPSFGAERRGVPVSASTRFSHQSIRIYSQVETPDTVMVLDATLLKDVNVLNGLKEGGWLVVNSWKKPEELDINGDFNIATADVTNISQRLGLALVNTAMLGAFSSVTSLVSLASIEKAIKQKLPLPAADVNAKAARMSYERTFLKRRQPKGDDGN